MNVAYLVFVYFFTEDFPSSQTQALYQFVLLVLALMFIVRENQQLRTIYHPHDFGFFALFVWPLFLPYYFVKTRGWRGILLFLLFVVLLIAETVVYLVWQALVQNAS